MIEPNRRKERALRDIIPKVIEWCELYAGVTEECEDGTQHLHEYSSKEAALKVGMAKRSLDDYIMKIRQARRLGYDFEANADEGFGQLRNFIKRKRQKT